MSQSAVGQQHEVIVEVGAEGGSLTLEGQCDAAGAWRFRSVRNEYTLLDFDEELSPEDLYGESEWVASWEEALALLDQYPWAELTALRVHPAFVDRVRAAVEERLLGAAASLGWRRDLVADRWQHVYVAAQSDRET